MDLSIFSLEELDELRQNATHTLKLLQSQVAKLPHANIPAINLIQIDEMQQRIAEYENEINSRGGVIPSSDAAELSSNPSALIRQLIQAGQTSKALDIFIRSLDLKENEELRDDVRLLSGRLTKADKDYQRGLLHRKDYLLEHNQVSNALLELLNSMS